MKQRTALLLAAAITAFALVVVGGIAARITGQAAADTSAATTVALPAPTADELAALTAREAAYQQRLAEANTRLEAAYQEQRRLEEQLSQAAPAPAAQAGVAPEQARAIALALAPGALLRRAPELVSFEGAPAYEVMLDQGTVYVDASDGRVLYDGVAAAQGGGLPWDEHEEHEHDERGEHEGDEHEDDED